MWIVASRERPHKLRRFLEACRTAETTTPILIVVDETDPYFDEYRLLHDNVLVRPGESIGAADKFRFAYERSPNLRWYGGLPDDCEPQTKGWDTALVEACMPDRIAWCFNALPSKRMVPFAWGGDLLRRFGGFLPPGLMHYGGDRFWKDVGIATGRLIEAKGHAVRFTDAAAGESWDTYDGPKRRQWARREEDNEIYREYIRSGYLARTIESLR